MKILLIEYAAFITEKLKHDETFLSHVEYFIGKGFSVRIIFSYGPGEHNPIIRKVEEFREFVRQCPESLPSQHSSSVVLTGELKSMLRAIKKEKGDDIQKDLPEEKAS